ncbi:MAG: ThuA domain-containing protein [Prolixibacteraceae bacterium]|nr:ThuA domain-containing protein [Prolixibacteraceae bacterium]MBN2775353.1 ThuA domain-containing protein [Prolixibacteraceae bacterium]
MSKLVSLLVIIMVLSCSAGKTGVSGKKILIYTKNGEGYVHENIGASIKAIQEICAAEGIETYVSDDPSVFTPENLEQYNALFFSNSNNEGFDTEAQKKAFQEYCRSGKGFGALHSANATERQWSWYWALVGGKFIRHAPYQKFDVVVIDKDHPSTSPLPQRWTIEDECYYSFQLNPDIHILLAADMTTVEDEGKAEYPDETFGERFPLCWCHNFEGGRQWYSAIGHNPEFYEDELFRAHIRGGILWILGIDK